MNFNIITNGTMMLMLVNTVVCLGQEYRTYRNGNIAVIHTNPLTPEDRTQEIISGIVQMR